MFFCYCTNNTKINEKQHASVHNKIVGNKTNKSLKNILNDKKNSLVKNLNDNYKQDITQINIKGASGAVYLSTILWSLQLIKNKIIVNDNIIYKYLNDLDNMLYILINIRNNNKLSDIWKSDLDEIDYKLITDKNPFNIKEKINCLKNLFDSLKNITKTQKNNEKIDKIYNKFIVLNKMKFQRSKGIDKFQSFKYGLKANAMLACMVKRGIITVNPHWWNFSDLFLTDILHDEGGVNTYRIGKKKYQKPLLPIKLLDKTVYLVTDVCFAKQILDQSPELFGPGNGKWNMFKNFMRKNVGISDPKPWKRRRKLNEEVLDHEHLHKYAKLYNNIISKSISKYKPTNSLGFNLTAKKIISNIVFADTKGIPKELFKTLDDANSIISMINPKYKVKSKYFQKFKKYINNNISNPQPRSLVDYAINETSIKYCTRSKSKSDSIDKNINNIGKICRSEIYGQIPHWIFPIFKLIQNTIPRTMLFLYSHKDKLKKLIKEIKKIDIDDPRQIYDLKFLRYSILETLRLNNTNTGLLRTLKQNYSFDIPGYYSFKKGDQFIILNNPVTRDNEKFSYPNKFIPERWENRSLEDSYYSIMFGQGKQKCPGKELALFIAESFIVNYLAKSNFKFKAKFNGDINKNNIKQMVNPFKIIFCSGM